jgi:hypothetical protein
VFIFNPVSRNCLSKKDYSIGYKTHSNNPMFPGRADIRKYKKQLSEIKEFIEQIENGMPESFAYYLFPMWLSYVISSNVLYLEGL